MIDEKILKNEERAIYSLRSLYRDYGYSPFKMSRFEEYDLYVRNKDFLVGDSVITFNDTDGRLLAMKPDVTLSIIKNSAFKEGIKNRVYYNENVYRVSGSTHKFKEIMQTGVECVGDVDLYDKYEVIYLGIKSLSLISESFAFDISHMGVLSAYLDSLTDSKSFKSRALKLISNKNTHELLSLAEEYGIDADKAENLTLFTRLHGKPEEVLCGLRPLLVSDEITSAYNELSDICRLLKNTEYYEKVSIDFSVLNDMNYYNGLVFKGFLLGICESVLSGGEYMPLIKRMKKAGSGVGFAIYLDLLSELSSEYPEYDFDVLLLYSEGADIEKVINKKEELISNGKTVAVGCLPNPLYRYKETITVD